MDETASLIWSTSDSDESSSLLSEDDESVSSSSDVLRNLLIGGGSLVDVRSFFLLFTGSSQLALFFCSMTATVGHLFLRSAIHFSTNSGVLSWILRPGIVELERNDQNLYIVQFYKVSPARTLSFGVIAVFPTFLSRSF